MQRQLFLANELRQTKEKTRHNAEVQEVAAVRTEMWRENGQSKVTVYVQKSKYTPTRPRTRFLVLAIQRFDGSAGSFSSVSE